MRPGRADPCTSRSGCRRPGMATSMEEPLLDDNHSALVSVLASVCGTVRQTSGLPRVRCSHQAWDPRRFLYRSMDEQFYREHTVWVDIIVCNDLARDPGNDR